MIRRFNYTGRQKIPRNKVSLILSKSKEERSFSINMNLDDLNVPPTSNIYVTAYYKQVSQRFSLGKVAEPIIRGTHAITELPDTDILYFDVLVVDETGEFGKILASAKGIPAGFNNTPQNKKPLLPVNAIDLKNQIWKISFDSSYAGEPVLEINKNIPGLTDMARNDPKFISLVYPVALRIVLEKLVKPILESDETDTWVADWKDFIFKNLGIKSLPETNSDSEELSNEQIAWIDSCIELFCAKNEIMEKFNQQ